MADLYLNQSRPVFGQNGGLEAGAKVYFYLTQTTTETPSYTTSALTTEHPHPVEANAAGVFPDIYLDTDNITYRAILKDADGNTLSDVDPYYPGDLNDAVAANVAAAAASATAAAESEARLSVASQYAVAVQSYGQSLGRDRSPQVTTSFASKLVTFDGGYDPQYLASYTGNTAHWQDVTEYGSLVGWSQTEDKESWGPGLGYYLAQDTYCKKIAFYQPAIGAQHYRTLAPGTGPYQNLVSAARRQKELLEADGYDNANIYPITFWTQGESDADTTPPGGSPGGESVVSQAQYLLILQKVRDALRFDMANIYRRTMSGLPLFVTPLASQVAAGAKNIQASYIDAIADEGIIIMPPHYQFWEEMETDGTHLGGQGRRYYAELAASIAKRVQVDGLNYQCPHVTSNTINGSTVELTFATPGDRDMVIDTSTFADPALDANDLYGIKYYDTSAAAYVDITSITVSGRVVTVTPSVTPAAGDLIEIAQQPWPGGTNIAANTPRSNLRMDGLEVTAEDGTTLYHYALPQTVTVA